MADPIPITPLLTVFADGSEYTIRASGEQGKRLGVSFVARMGEYSKVTFITDTDIKVYKASHGMIIPETPADEAPERPTPERRVFADGAAPPQPEQVEEFEQELAEQRRAELEIKEMEKLNAQHIPQPEPVDPPQPARRGRPVKERDSPGSPTVACGRCGGTGQASDTGFGGQCPVCRGAGSVTPYGRRSGRGGSFKDSAR
jgi:hypothetical protein